MAEEGKNEEKKDGVKPGGFTQRWYETLVEYGIPAVLAAAIVAAAYGVLVVLGVTGCTASYTQTAEGDVQLHGTVTAPSTVTGGKK